MPAGARRWACLPAAGAVRWRAAAGVPAAAGWPAPEARAASRVRLGRTLGPRGVEHVLLADPPADPGPGHPLQVHAVLGGQLADQWVT